MSVAVAEHPAGAAAPGRTVAQAVRGVVFDWAGTLVDHGSLAPVSVFVEAFRVFGVDVTTADARAPMGLPKRDHIQAMGARPGVAAAWAARRGRPFGEADVDAVYERFLPAQVAAVARYATPVPGAVETFRGLRDRGIAIGSTSGYTREIMDALVPAAAAQGIAPDSVIATGDLAESRPSPLMCLKTMVDLAVWPAAAWVKVDDTVPGIDEGRNAGFWTVGVAVTGNGVGLSLADWQALTPEEQATRRAASAAPLAAAGAHYVIDGVGDLIPVIDALSQRIAAGERP